MNPPANSQLSPNSPHSISDESTLGLAGWYDPRRLLWALPSRLRRWAPLLAGSGAMLGVAVALLALSSTFRLNATLRLAPPAQSLSVEVGLESYRMPDFHPEEIQSWFHRTTIYEALKAALNRGESVDELRSMFAISFDRDAALFHIELSGAESAVDAERLLSAFCNLVIDEAKQQVRVRVRADEDFYRRKARDHVAELDEAKRKLAEFVETARFVGVEAELTARQERALTARRAVTDAQMRLDALRERRAAIPTLIEALPSEVPGGRSLRNGMALRLDELKAEERRLGAMYTDENPQLIAVRAQYEALDQATTEAAGQAGTPDSMLRNPVVGMLETEHAHLQLAEPQAVREVERLREQSAEADAALAELPELAARFRGLAGAVESRERVSSRLETRVAEIEIANGLSTGQLQTSDIAKQGYASERSKALKVVLCAFAGAFAGFGLSLVIAVIGALRDPALRTPMDYRLVLGAAQVERVPAPAASIAEHRLWLQRIAEYVAAGAKSALLVPSLSPRDSALIARALAEQIARSGLKTLLIADAGLLGLAQGKGLSHVLDREAHPEQALTELDQRLSLLGIGDLPRLLDQVPSGNVERLVSELAHHFDFLLVAPPAGEIALLRRLATSLAVLIVAVDHRGMSRSIADELGQLQRPVALVLVGS